LPESEEWIKICLKEVGRYLSCEWSWGGQHRNKKQASACKESFYRQASQLADARWSAQKFKTGKKR